ncbi:hypothetical protein Pla110_08000 [Polystyrenella longa]|uniref:Uncharacterized protein n=1 Tax=Polystyrenella longa TaxID=2528007 RepID=A0A518CIN8_9PLAN|nr:hypothetical protein Pla110_08000 [Polystyrenella longa]
MVSKYQLIFGVLTLKIRPVFELLIQFIDKHSIPLDDEFENENNHSGDLQKIGISGYLTFPPNMNPPELIEIFSRRNVFHGARRETHCFAPRFSITTNVEVNY